MTIRKTGAVTGQITGVEQQPEGVITATASVTPGEREEAWDPGQEQALAEENQAADGG